MSLNTTIPVSDFLQAANVAGMQIILDNALSAEILDSSNNSNQNFTALWDNSGVEIYDLTSIGSNAFAYSGKTGLSIGNSVTSIENYAFYICFGFTGSLTIPNSVTSIGSYAFYGCSFTGSLTIPNLVTSIGNGAFQYCSGFTGSLTIPNSVTDIGSGAFNYCSGFTGSLTIPNSVTDIGSGAFGYCSGFTGSLTIGDSVITTGVFMFFNCVNLTNVNSYITKTLLDKTNNLAGTSVTTIHARSSDGTWTAGADQTIGGKTGITVIKDL